MTPPDDVLERLSAAGHRVEVGRRLAGGLTNRTWAVRFDGMPAALRVRREAPGSRLPVAVEAAVMRGVGPLAPEVLYWDDEALVTRFVQRTGNAPPEAVGRALARLHRLEMPDLRRFDLRDWLRTATWPAPMTAASSLARALAERLPEVPPVPCHHDLSPENIVYDGAVRLLDWEYAACADPAVDLFGATRGRPSADVHALLSAYAAAGGPGRWSDTVAEGVTLLEQHWHATRRT